MHKYINSFGHCADPALPDWKNAMEYVANSPAAVFFKRVVNTSCHVLCKNPPRGAIQVIGIGLKFCIKKTRPPNQLEASFDRFKEDVRWTSHFFNKPRVPDGRITYIPELHFRSEFNFAPSATKAVERSLRLFEHDVIQRRSKLMRPTISNIFPRHAMLANDLRLHDDFIVVEADKNLGGCILDRDTYIERAISEHLSNKSVYRLLDDREAHTLQRKMVYMIEQFINKYRPLDDEPVPNRITPAEEHFLYESSRRYKLKWARFRLTIKVHKDPWKTRPVVCCAGTLLNQLSKWLDFWLQKLRSFVPSYIKNSDELIEKLKGLGRLPLNARLFTADADSMYTNIDTPHAIEVISKWLDNLSPNLHQQFPLGAVKEAMKIVMTGNIFQFGDAYFLQLLGTAMGTSAACMWATIYFSVHESDCLLPGFGDKLFLYVRYIDDIFGIWIGDSDEDWKQFQLATNSFGMLKWKFSELAYSIDFLDLTVKVNNGGTTVRTYQKLMNLYQYISPHSAHPPGLIKGMIYGLVKTYHRQNSDERDYISIVSLLHNRLVERGWDGNHIKRLILWADETVRRRHREALSSNLTNSPITPPPLVGELSQPNSPRTRIFFHLEYHPADIPRRILRDIYERRCQAALRTIGVTTLTIAYSRPSTLQQALTRAQLHQAAGRTAKRAYHDYDNR